MINSKIDIRLATLVQKYDLHTVLLSKIINGIATVGISLSGNDNKKISWLVGSQVQLRFEVANLLGIEVSQNAAILFQFNKEIQSNVRYPSLDSFNLEWKKISSILRTEILDLDNEDLFSYSEGNPEMKGTFFDLLSGVMERETNTISVLTILLV